MLITMTVTHQAIPLVDVRQLLQRTVHPLPLAVVHGYCLLLTADCNQPTMSLMQITVPCASFPVQCD